MSSRADNLDCCKLRRDIDSPAEFQGRIWGECVISATLPHKQQHPMKAEGSGADSNNLVGPLTP